MRRLRMGGLASLLLVAASPSLAAANPAATPARSAATPAGSATSSPPVGSSSDRTGWFPSDSAIRAILQERVETAEGAGIVVGLLENRATRIVAYGQSGGPRGRALDGRTVFEIGSVTKVFTATLLADMVRRGEVRLDQPVAELLPATVRVPARDGRQITLLDLATHRSGLPRLPSNLEPRDRGNPYADYSVARLYDFLSRHELNRGIGERYEYSNLGVGVLGHALALRAGKPYEELLIERVLEPLGMRGTRITLTGRMKARLAARHDASGQPAGTWDLPTLAGAGALRSTVNDLLRFLAANLDTGRTPILEVLRETHRVHAQGAGPHVDIGLAWHTLRSFGAQIVMHNGGTGGYRSFIGYDPEVRVGVVVLANSAGDLDDIGLHLLNEKFPLQKKAIHTEVRMDPARLEAYVGRYELAPNFVLMVTREGDALFIEATGQARLPVFAESDSTFFYRAVEARVTFRRDGNGAVTGLVLHQNGRDLPGKRVR